MPLVSGNPLFGVLASPEKYRKFRFVWEMTSGQYFYGPFSVSPEEYRN